MIEALLFDKDGTLIDFQKTWGRFMAGFLRDLAEGDEPLAGRMAASLRFDLGRALFAPDSPVIAGTPDDATDLLLPFLPDWTRDRLSAYGDEQSQLAQVVEVTPLAPLLSRFQTDGYKLGVATNDTEAAGRAHIDQLGVSAQFDQVIGFDTGFGAKPAPGMVLGFCQRLDIAPETCVMVGDSLHDLDAGRTAGALCVGVLTGVAGRDVLSPVADVVLDDISQLPDWLAKTDAGRR